MADGGKWITCHRTIWDGAGRKFDRGIDGLDYANVHGTLVFHL